MSAVRWLRDTAGAATASIRTTTVGLMATSRPKSTSQCARWGMMTGGFSLRSAKLAHGNSSAVATKEIWCERT